MAFRQPAFAPRQPTLTTSLAAEFSSQALLSPQRQVEESQEWILFSPSQDESSTDRTQTAGLSRASDLGSLNTAARSGRLESSVLEEDHTEDGELDDLDDNLQAFRDPALYQTSSSQNAGALLPTHDGLGTFPASSPPVQDQLWQHEQYNPKRKHEGQHRRTSSIQRRLDTIEELDAQVNDEKRMRIEKWRLEQSQALIEEVEKQTRRKLRQEFGRQSSSVADSASVTQEILGTTPRQSDYLKTDVDEPAENEPFWRRITRRFIRDVIGIDEPLLSVILGETLPAEIVERVQSTSSLPTIPEQLQLVEQPVSLPSETWRDRLLQRIARELGVLVHQLSPHPGAFSTYLGATLSDAYAGIPIQPSSEQQRTRQNIPLNEHIVGASTSTQTFRPTVPEQSHVVSWGLDEDPKPASTTTSLQASEVERLRQEREYWERELDVKMIFRFLKDRFSSTTAQAPERDDDASVDRRTDQDSAKRAAIIRQYHPLAAAHRSPARLRRDSRLSARRPGSSCASESAKSSQQLKASLIRSGSSRNYWDIGGSVGSGSIMASGGLIGAWGEV